MITGDDFNPRAGRGRGGLRGLGGSCCSSCATGLGDAASPGGGLLGGAPNWLLIASLTIGAVAGSLAIYDHFSKKRRRVRRRQPTNIEGRSTQQIPVQSMHELVYGGRRAA